MVAIAAEVDGLLDLDEEGVRELARTSVRASFAPDDVRRQLLAAIDDHT